MQAVGQGSVSAQESERVVVESLTPLRQRHSFSRWLVIVICLLPALLLFCLFVLVPVAQAVYTSLYHWSGLGPLTNFVGLNNYVQLLKDQVFLNAVKTNLTIVILSVGVQIPVSLLLALLVRRRTAGVTFFRTVFFLPYILSEVVAALIWYFVYEPSSGLLSGILKLFNPTALPPAYLADPHTVLGAIFIAMCWKYFGFHLMLYVAGLQNIPEELSDAARIDGANRWQVVRYVLLPLLGSTIRLSIFLSILGSLQYFDLVFVISNGGPVHASETMATYLIHRGFQNFAFGYGTAVGVVMFILCLIFALFYQRLVMRRDLAGAVQ